ncbi:uncharacterized protein LOC144661959 isoform X2 [Oculina patagonica]
MKLLSFVLFLALETLLVDYASSSSCPPLNRTLFNDCIQAGYNVSNFTSSRSPNVLSSLIANMQNKFKNCSSFSSLMTCSVHLPKCSAGTSTLPCKEVCKNFVADCQHSSSADDGLIALFRGICELLPSSKCLPKPNNLNNTNPEAVKCEELVIKQCQNAGYNSTSVSNAYQKMVQSSTIFQDSDANSALRKIICMEIAPPCDAKNNQKLLVPCRSMCDEAYNKSRSKFLDVFKSRDYCSAFPENTHVDGKEYCSLQAWPVNGFWPSGLWTSLTSAAQQQNCTVDAPKDNSTTSAPVVNTTTSAPSGNTTTSPPTTTAPVVNTTTSAPKGNTTTSAPSGNATTTKPTGNLTTLAPKTNGTAPAPKTNGTKPTPTSHVTTPAATSKKTTTESHKSSTSSNPSSGTKGSPPVVSAHKGGKMSGGAIAGTVLGILALLVAIVVGVICFRKHHKTRSQYRHSLMVDMDEL